MREEREDAAEGEPLNTETRTVQDLKSGLYINPTDFGARTHSIEQGDEVIVETYADRIEIRRAGDE